MNANNKPAPPLAKYTKTQQETLKLLARLRQDQLEAALAGRVAESAFYATEANVLREQLAKQGYLFISA